MSAYRRVYDSRHLQADCKGPGSAPEPYVDHGACDAMRCILGNRVWATFFTCRLSVYNFGYCSYRRTDGANRQVLRCTVLYLAILLHDIKSVLMLYSLFYFTILYKAYTLLPRTYDRMLIATESEHLTVQFYRVILV